MSKPGFAFAPSIQPCLCIVIVTNYRVACCCLWNRCSCGVKGTGGDRDPILFSCRAREVCSEQGWKKPLSFRQLSGTVAECMLMLCVSVPAWSSVNHGTGPSKAPCYLCTFLGV